MKRNYRNLFMVGVMAFAACFTGCKEETPALNVTVNGSEEFAEEIRSTSASFTLKTDGVESVAYLVEEGNVSESTKDAAVVYAEAEENGRVVTVADGANTTIKVFSLEGGKEYTIFFVYTKDGQLKIESKVFTTPAYDRLITVVESRKDGFKFHFNVPDTMNYKYALLPTEQYNAFRASYRADDITFLNDGIQLKGPQTIDYTSEQDWYEEGDGGFYIHPGSAFTLMIAECDAEGNVLNNLGWVEEDEVYEDEDYWDGEAYDPETDATRAGVSAAPRMGGYTEEPWYDDYMYPTGLYARQNLLAALEMVESKVDVKLIGKTERRIKIRCTADEDVQYVIAPFEKSQYNELINLVTEDAIASTLLEYFGYEQYSGTMDFEIDENWFYPELDSTYVISVVGVYEEDASVISHDTLHVTLTKSTLPAAELTITGCENPYGDPTPNLVWFNIKSEKKNVYSAKHIANYTKDVVKELNYGFTYADLITYYGGELSEEDVQAINSDEGLYLSLYSLEDAENTLIVAAYNEEEGEAIYTGVSRAASLPTLPEVNSTLFEDLKGDWTARVIRIKSEYDYDIWDYVYSRDTVYTTISLGGNFDNSPESFDASHEAYEMVYDSYYMSALDKGATDEEAAVAAEKRVAEQFAEYKKMVTKYEEKYKGQNYILGLGLEAAHVYATPWDLFCSPEYSAYDAEELFYAYGPKLFFQVQQDGTLALLGDANILSLPPVAAWGWYEYVLVGNNPDDASFFYSGAFPVEVSDDKNTLVIKGVTEDGMMFYPAIGYLDWGVSYLEGGFQTIADIQLTRGAVEAEAVATRAAQKVDLNKVAKSQNNRIKRTYLPTEDVKIKTVKMKYIPVLDLIKEKYSALMSK